MRRVAGFLSKLFSGPLDVSWLDDLAATGLALPDGLYVVTPKTDVQGTTLGDNSSTLNVRGNVHGDIPKADGSTNDSALA